MFEQPVEITKPASFNWFASGPEIIRLAATPFVRFLLSPWFVEDPLRERGNDMSDETVRFWWSWTTSLGSKKIRLTNRNSRDSLFSSLHSATTPTCDPL